jgi:hypothetical protein
MSDDKTTLERRYPHEPGTLAFQAYVVLRYRSLDGKHALAARGAARVLDDPEVVHVSGVARVERGRHVEGHPGWVVLRTIRDEVVLERGVDFMIEDEHGGTVYVEIADAQLRGVSTMEGVVGVREGGHVEVIGRRAQRIDQRGDTLLRDAPSITCLSGTKDRPLVVLFFDALLARERS